MKKLEPIDLYLGIPAIIVWIITVIALSIIYVVAWAKVILLLVSAG